MGDKVDNQTTVVIGTPEEIEAYKARAEALIEHINARNLDYRIDTQNSNSMAGTILKSFGIPPQALLNSKKHSFQKPVPGFLTDLYGEEETEPRGETPNPGSGAQQPQRGHTEEWHAAKAPRPKPEILGSQMPPVSGQRIPRRTSAILSPAFPGDLGASRRSVSFLSATEPPRRPDRGQVSIEPDRGVLANPFDLRNQDLKLQATMLKRNPGLAERLILSAGRDPRMFGL
ncbi:hypothetical protein [Roseibium aggregatum]|uniref:Uncharacterized protein n=1 Tax=Roseibium aggregatum TaxID=187304 RepID=A0A939J5G4_9HYPH|nr:hypothetical protein [Roseibium aggregatum]MBN9671699.1 hypothetical protein [Roseibium aggregatum]